MNGRVRFVSVSLVEPSKAVIAAHIPNAVIIRRALILFLDFDAGATFEATTIFPLGNSRN